MAFKLTILLLQPPGALALQTCATTAGLKFSFSSKASLGWVLGKLTAVFQGPSFVMLCPYSAPSLLARGQKMRVFEEHTNVSMGCVQVVLKIAIYFPIPRTGSPQTHTDKKKNHFSLSTSSAGGKLDSLVGSWHLCYTCLRIMIQWTLFWSLFRDSHFPNHSFLTIINVMCGSQRDPYWSPCVKHWKGNL